MRKNVTRALIVAIAALGLIASACGGDDESSDKSTTTTEASNSGGDRGNVDGQLKLGNLVPQTGDLNVIVKSLETPVAMAVKAINDAGGVNVNQLMSSEPADIERLAGMARLTGIPVSVQPAVG